MYLGTRQIWKIQSTEWKTKNKVNQLSALREQQIRFQLSINGPSFAELTTVEFDYGC